MKQVIVARVDLNMSPGKLAAQVAHAAISAYTNAERDSISRWRKTGMTKIVLSVNSEEELLNTYKKAVAAYLPVALICDEGRTEVEPGTITCVGIGPAPDTTINSVTGALKLYGWKESEVNGKEG